ncbi:hypothetical protein ACFWY5_28130 [Nonomuraea sp. NPDC059007]|uniref:hypothetical protein n=1 Tax=Nonomuraea sp. NPDC059007 TaxID=3346692 RepID=UPI0036C2FEDE
MRTLGSVVAETISRESWDGTETVSDVLFVDMGSATGPVVTRVADRLRSKGWHTTGSDLPKWEAMRLSGNAELEVSINAMGDYIWDDMQDPQMGDVVRSVRQRFAPQNVAVVVITQSR